MRLPMWLASFCALATLGVVACGDASDGTSNPATTAPATTVDPATTTTNPTTTTPSPTTTTTAPCSATGLSPTVDAQAGLPAAVATMRVDLARAAATCDWTALAALVDRNGAGVRFSFGTPGDAIA